MKSPLLPFDLPLARLCDCLRPSNNLSSSDSGRLHDAFCVHPHNDLGVHLHDGLGHDGVCNHLHGNDVLLAAEAQPGRTGQSWHMPQSGTKAK